MGGTHVDLSGFRFRKKTIFSQTNFRSVPFFAFGLKMLYSGIWHKEGEDGGEDEIEEAKEAIERLEAANETKDPLLGETAAAV